MNTTSLRIGLDEIDITPPLGAHLLGDLCRHRPVDKIIDPLFARVLVAESQGQLVCVISVDLLSFNDETARHFRRHLADRYDLSPQAIMLHCTQNHSAPGVGHPFMYRKDSPYLSSEAWWLQGGDPDYPSQLLPRLEEAMDRAMAKLRPARVTSGGTLDERFTFNRRYLHRDGKAQTQPRAEDVPNLLCVEGPIDPEVGVAAFHNEQGQLLGAVLHYTAHPVSLFNTNHVTASWPGAWCAAFRKQFAGAVPIMINGCCGNINCRGGIPDFFKPEDEQIGAGLMAGTLRALAQGVTSDDATVAMRSRTVTMRLVAQEPETVQRAKTVLAEHPQVKWNVPGQSVDIEWAFAGLTLDIAEALAESDRYDYEVQSFRIGSLALVGLIGEPFVEGQLAIKAESPAERTFIAHMSNGHVGYIPTAAGHQRFNFNFRTPQGHYVRRGANLFRFDAGALDRIVVESRKQIAELWAIETA